jgi:hypothetical protein
MTPITTQLFTNIATRRDSEALDALRHPHRSVRRALPGDLIEVPSNAKHGFRNRSEQPVLQLIITTSKLGRFFQEIVRPVVPGGRISPPAPNEIEHFLETAGRYGYWLATPAENAAVGISLGGEPL